MSCSNFSSLASNTRSSAYFTVWMVSPHNCTRAFKIHIMATRSFYSGQPCAKTSSSYTYNEGVCRSGRKAPFILNHCIIIRVLVNSTPQRIFPGGHLGGHQSRPGIFERGRNVCSLPATKTKSLSFHVLRLVSLYRLRYAGLWSHLYITLSFNDAVSNREHTR